MPIPPTSREIAAIPDNNEVKVPVVAETVLIYPAEK